MRSPLNVNLTMPNTQHIAGEVRRLRAAFGRFRKQHFWKRNVVGGVLSIEITHLTKEARKKMGLKVTDPTGWHVHLHSLVDCKWLAIDTRCPRTSDSATTTRQLCEAAHRELSSEWGQCLGMEEAVTWANRAWQDSILEQIKYNVKPAELVECAGRVSELIDEIANKQLVNGFGTLYGTAKKWRAEDKASRAPTLCDHCGAEDSMMPTEALIRTARGGMSYKVKDKKLITPQHIAVANNMRRRAAATA